MVDALAPVPDVPIRSRRDDRLQRRGFADLVARQLRAHTDAGYVVALTGTWGSGKTSLLNMIDDSLSEAKDVVVVRFNPWLFSGTEQLVTHFFEELGKQLGEHNAHLAEIGKRLRRYGRLLTPLRFVPVAGPFLETAGSLASAASDAASQPPSLHRQREELTSKLGRLEYRIVVMVDDIDRLEDGEVRDIMRLVRLVGEFPAIAYILAFDAERTVRALSPSPQETEYGRRYMEKIVQLSYAVPELGYGELPRLLQEAMKNAVATLSDPGSWDDLHDAQVVVERLVETVRDVRRYSNVLPLALELLSDEVAAADILVLEALRVFLPDVHGRIPEVMDVLTEEDWEAESREEARRRLDAWINSAGNKSEVVRLLCETFFPDTVQFFGEPTLDPESERQPPDRRVSNAWVLRMYLEKALPAHVAPTPVLHELKEAFGSEEAMVAAVHGLTNRQLGDVMRRLGEHPPSASPEAAATAVAALVNSIDANEGATGEPLRRLTRAVMRDLDAADRDAFADNVLRRLKSPVWGVRFVIVVTGLRRADRQGNVVRRGGLVSEHRERQLAEDLVQKIRLHGRDALKQEPPVGSVINWLAKQGPEAVTLAHDLLDDDDCLISFAALVERTIEGASVKVLFPDSVETRRRFEQVKPRLQTSDDPKSRAALRSFARLLPDEVVVPRGEDD